MTWTYDPTQMATSPFMQVRRLIGDVIATDQQIADEEITFALAQRGGSIYGAAADACRYISAQYSRKSDVVVQAQGGGALKTNYSQQAKAYATMAAQLDGKSTVMGSGLPFVGGISVQQKQAAVADSDRVKPQFNLGMDDNFLPEGPVGNETQSGNPTTSSDT